MKKTTIVKKLSLSKETLHWLESGELQATGGASPVESNIEDSCFSCTLAAVCTWGCPTGEV